MNKMKKQKYLKQFYSIIFCTLQKHSKEKYILNKNIQQTKKKTNK